MFSTSAASLSKKREGILGQFQKAINGLIKVNDEIDLASDQCAQRQDALQVKVDAEDNEQIDLSVQKAQNEKTIKKMQDMFV